MTERESIYVVGAGGHGKVVVSIARALGIPVDGVFDEDPAAHGGELLGAPVLGPPDATRSDHRRAILAIGDNRSRQRLDRELDFEWGTLVHPTAIVHPSVSLGEGTVVCAGVVLQPDVRLGRHGIVNTGASVDHDAVLGEFVHVAPGCRLGGGVQVGDGALLGIGSCAIPGRRIGAWTVVGAGAAVVDDLADGVTAVGVPARSVEGR